MPMPMQPELTSCKGPELRISRLQTIHIATADEAQLQEPDLARRILDLRQVAQIWEFGPMSDG
jgi:hypothetical protein